MVVGELSLDGSVRHVRGVLPIAAKARQQGIKILYALAEDGGEEGETLASDRFPQEHATDLGRGRDGDARSFS